MRAAASGEIGEAPQGGAKGTPARREWDAAGGEATRVATRRCGGTWIVEAPFVLEVSDVGGGDEVGVRAAESSEVLEDDSDDEEESANESEKCGTAHAS